MEDLNRPAKGDPGLHRPSMGDPVIYRPSTRDPDLHRPAVHGRPCHTPAVHPQPCPSPAVRPWATLSYTGRPPATLSLARRPAMGDPVIYRPPTCDPVIYRPSKCNPVLHRPSTCDPAFWRTAGGLPGTLQRCRRNIPHRYTSLSAGLAMQGTRRLVLHHITGPANKVLAKGDPGLRLQHAASRLQQRPPIYHKAAAGDPDRAGDQLASQPVRPWLTSSASQHHTQ